MPPIQYVPAPRTQATRNQNAVRPANQNVAVSPGQAPANQNSVVPPAQVPANQNVVPPVNQVPLNQNAPPPQNVVQNAAVQNAPATQNQNGLQNVHFQQGPPPPPATVEVWKTAPDRGNFNPGTRHGQMIFNEKSKGLPEDKRLDLTRSNGPAIHKLFRARETHLSGIVNIPTEFDQFGRVSETSNLLSQHHKITLEDCQRAGHVLFQDAFRNADDVTAPPFYATTQDPANVPSHQDRFYDIVNNNVVVKIIQNSLTVNGFDDLLEHKSLFSYANANGDVEFHAATMIHIMYENTDPTTEVGMDSILKGLETAKMSDFGNNADLLLKFMEKSFNTLKNNGQEPKNYRRLLLDALVTGPNHVFNEYMQRIIDDVESGTGFNATIKADQIVKGGRSKYNNMFIREQWNKVDPRDAELLALKTQVINLEKKRAAPVPAPTALATDAKKTKNQTKEPHLDWNKVEGTNVDKWRVVKKGETIEAGGKTSYWCKHHKLDGKWDGMYCWHKPEDCPKLLANKTGGPNEDKDKAKPGNLQLKSNLKSVMMSSLCLSSEDVEKMFSEAQAQEN